MVEIKAEIDEQQSFPKVVDSALLQHLTGEGVSISLKYYHKSCECFGAWGPKELKKFSGIIEKISGYNPTLLKQTNTLCDMHKGPPKHNRFSRPSSISEDIQFFELKVDSSNKARIHGFFVENVFFLVWLDNKHQCFPQ